MSIYFDGHANLFKSIYRGKGKYLITFVGVILLVSQIIIFIMYLQSHLSAIVFTYELIFFNFIAPLFVVFSLIYVESRFSGSPIRAAVYS